VRGIGEGGSGERGSGERGGAMEAFPGRQIKGRSVSRDPRPLFSSISLTDHCESSASQLPPQGNWMSHHLTLSLTHLFVAETTDN